MNKEQLERIWIFPCDKNLEGPLSDEIIGKINSFLSQWKAHGKQLLSKVELLEGHFIKISVDESFENASGCSIDTLVKFIQTIESEYSLNFTDRSRVYFKTRNNSILSENFQNIRTLIQSGDIIEKTFVFNTALNNSLQFEKSWILEAKDTWMKKYFQNIAV